MPRPTAAVALLLALACAGASALVAAPALAESRSACDAAVPDDPLVTATAFVTAAVERRSTAAAFRLTTSSLRKGTTCRDWAVGRLPVGAFLRIDWRRSTYRLLAAGEGQVVLRIVLGQPGEDVARVPDGHPAGRELAGLARGRMAAGGCDGLRPAGAARGRRRVRLGVSSSRAAAARCRRP